jgi:hypothetical protein
MNALIEDEDDGAADTDPDADPDDAHISSEPEVDGGTFGDGLVTIDGAAAGASLFSLEHASARPAGSA